jgi:hypothetical protein
MKRKFSDKERQYWSNALIALSQVTFGVVWASIFLPLDLYKTLVVLSNLVLSVALLGIGWYIMRRK